MNSNLNRCLTTFASQTSFDMPEGYNNRGDGAMRRLRRIAPLFSQKPPVIPNGAKRNEESFAIPVASVIASRAKQSRILPFCGFKTPGLLRRGAPRNDVLRIFTLAMTLLLTFGTASTSLFAQTKTFTHDYTYSSTDYSQFLVEIKERIHKSKYEAAKVVNQEIIRLYWDIGQLITEKQQTLGWGKSVVETLSEDLQKEFPGSIGFSKSNLWSMAQFYSEYNEDTILQPLVGEISWSKHLVIMSKCKDKQERQFYILATKKFGWTKDVLMHQVEIKTYERYLLGQTNFFEE